MEQIKKGANISSVTVFGLQDGYRFYSSDSTKTRLLDHDLQKKPNYEAIMKVLKSNKKENQKIDDKEKQNSKNKNTESESESSSEEEKN